MYHGFARTGKERWVIVRTHAQMHATREHLEKKVQKTQQEWEKRLWHLSKQSFACANDAQQAGEKALKGKPSWLVATFTIKEQGQYEHRGRPKKEATPDQIAWSLVPYLEVDQHEVTVLVNKKAAFIVATNLLGTQRLSHEQVISTYKEQGGVERGCAFSQRSFVSGLLNLCQEARARDCIELRDGALLVGLSARLRICCAASWRQRNKRFPIRSTNLPIVQPCAGFSNVLKGLISYISI